MFFSSTFFSLVCMLDACEQILFYQEHLWAIPIFLMEKVWKTISVKMQHFQLRVIRNTVFFKYIYQEKPVKISINIPFLSSFEWNIWYYRYIKSPNMASEKRNRIIFSWPKMRDLTILKQLENINQDTVWRFP